MTGPVTFGLRRERAASAAGRSAARTGRPRTTGASPVTGTIIRAISSRRITGNAKLFGVSATSGNWGAGSHLARDLATHAQAPLAGVATRRIATDTLGAETAVALIARGTRGSWWFEPTGVVHAGVGRETIVVCLANILACSGGTDEGATRLGCRRCTSAKSVAR